MNTSVGALKPNIVTTQLEANCKESTYNIISHYLYLNFNRQFATYLIQHVHPIWPLYHTTDIPIIRIGTVPYRTVTP